MIADALASLLPSSRSVSRYVNATLENPRFSLNDPAAYETLTAGARSASGVTVTHEGSLALSAVWQALSLISGDGSKIPVYPFERLEDDDRKVADKHPSYVAVAVRANQWKSAKRFWADLIVHMLLWRNGYAFINRSGPRIELYNLLPDRTAPKWVTVLDPAGRKRSELIYETEVAGQIEIVLPQNILHVRQWSLDGLTAPDLVRAAKDAWGLALAAQNFESKFFKNGARKGGILELPVMSKPARDTVEEGFRKSYEDGDNPFRTVILREGAKFHEGQVTPREGQVAELKDSQKREVASYFNIPPSKLGIRDSVSYNSFEQDNLSYLHGCLHHVCDAISDECDMKLLSESDLLADKYYFEHNYSEFIQSDWKTMNEGLEIQRRNEIINANDWRRKLNMPKRTDPEAETYINPNTKSAQDAKAASGGKSPNGEGVTGDDNPSEESNTLTVLELTLALQKIYLAVGKVISAEEAREILNRGGAGLSEELPDGLPSIPQPAAPFGGGGGDEYSADENLKKPTDPENAHRKLLSDVLGRMARRVGFDSRKASADPRKFAAWLDSNADEHRNLFDDAVKPAAQACASMFLCESSILCAKAHAEFFDADDGLLCKLREFIEPPHAAADLERNVDAYLKTFERNAPDRIAAKLLEAVCLSTE